MKGSGCYNCPVKGCTAAYRGSRCAHLRELAGVDFDPMTNADRLRSMTDEELAAFIVDKSPGMFSSNGRCLHWLRQPTKED